MAKQDTSGHIYTIHGNIISAGRGPRANGQWKCISDRCIGRLGYDIPDQKRELKNSFDTFGWFGRIAATSENA